MHTIIKIIEMLKQFKIIILDCLLAGSGWNILILLASSQQNLYDIYLLL